MNLLKRSELPATLLKPAIMKMQLTMTHLTKTGLLWMFTLLVYVSLALSAMAQTTGFERLPQLATMQQAGLLVLDNQNQPVMSKNAHQAFVPASTTKLLTAYLALLHWGDEHRFKTDFFIKTDQQSTVLWIKGYGDPFLVSEELKVIAQKISGLLAQRGLKEITDIRLDASYFEHALNLPGTSETDNPYDAVPSALATNFNTLYLYNQAGKVYSAETQTPMTPLAHELGQNVSSTKTRVNTGADATLSQRYFAELLAAFLRQQGVSVSERIEWKKLPGEAAVADYQHLNSRTLLEMIRPMMTYSTNFIANQLALMMAADVYGAPVNAKKVKQLYRTQLAHYFDWNTAVIEEGAGLSRNNRLSPQQLTQLLQAFKPWQALLPEVAPGVVAKTGTLLGVSTLAGYIQKNQDWLPFALMINQDVPSDYRNLVVRQLRLELNQAEPPLKQTND